MLTRRPILASAISTTERAANSPRGSRCAPAASETFSIEPPHPALRRSHPILDGLAG